MKYRSGCRHADVDCLSRLPLPTANSEEDTFNDCLAAIAPEFPDATIFSEDQRNDVNLEPLFVMALNPKASGGFSIRDSLLYKTNHYASGARFLLVVPESFRSAVLHAMHDDPTSGHLGFARTLQRVQERFYWPHMRQTTKQYVASCDQCQRRK